MKRFIRILGIFLVCLLLIAVCLPFFVNPNQFRGLLAAQLGQALGREVAVGELKLALLSGGIEAGDLSIADDPAFGKTPFVQAKSLKIGLKLWPLISSRRLEVTRLTLEQPQIMLLQNGAGDWNFSTVGAKKTAAEPARANTAAKQSSLDLSVKRIEVSEGRVTLGKSGTRSKPQVWDRVSIEVRDFSPSSAFPFSLAGVLPGGGNFKLQGTAGPIDAADASATNVETTLSAAGVDLARSGLVDAAYGMEGILAVDGKIRSAARRVHLEARLTAERLKLAKRGSAARKAVALDCVVEHDAQKRTGTLRRGDIHIGAAAAHLTGAYDLRGQTPLLNLKLAGPNMPIPELAAMLPALDIVLPAGSSIQGGTASAHLTLAGPANRLAGGGTLALENTRLAGFDLGSKIALVQRLAGIKGGPDTDIKVLSALVKTAPEGTSMDDIKLVAPAIGELSGAGTISPENALNFKMKVTLHTSGALMERLGQKGDTTLPLLIEGTASNPVFKPDVRSLATEQLKNVTKGDPRQAATDLLKGLLRRRQQK